MKIIEVSNTYSIEPVLKDSFDFLEYELIRVKAMNFESFKSLENFNNHDLGFIVFVDMESVSYIKYMTLRQAVGFTEEQVIWLTTKRKKIAAIQDEAEKNVLTDEEHFGKLNRKIISIHDTAMIIKSIMKSYHFYSELRLLQASQETIQKILKSMLVFLGEGILILDDKRQIIFMNRVAEEISGYSESEALNEPFDTVFPIYNALTHLPIENVLQELDADNPTKGLPFNTILIDRQGNEKYISANVSYLFKSLLKGYFIILRDITRIIVAENNFRRLSKAVEYSPASVIIFKDNSAIEYVNPAFQSLTGYTQEEVEGKSIRILTSKETPMSKYLELWDVLQKGKVWDGTLRNQKKNGETYWEKVHAGPIFNDLGIIDRFVAINLDNTLEMDMTERIRVERNNMYSLINTAPIGLMLFEDNQHFGNINNRADAIISKLGITIDQLLEFKEIYSEATLFEHLLDVVHNKSDILQNEYYYEQSDQTQVFLRLGAVPFTVDESESALIAIDDITSAKLIERQLEVARDEAKEADKAKSMFLANMSHEIRTPINGIIGMTDITLANGNLSQEDEANLKLVKLSSKNLLQIVNDILDISKLDAGKIEFEKIPFNVEIIVLSTLKLFDSKAKIKDLEFIIDIEDSAKIMLLGDPLRLQQCITNLINNAIKFTEVGFVKTRVSLTEIDHDQQRAVLNVEVSDSGIGIGSKESNMLFKRFSQVDSSITRQYGGTGLGLAITQSLVQLQNGTISVNSEKGIGSVFSFQIPYEISTSEEISFVDEVKDMNQETHKQKIWVLIVEDELINQMIIRKYLSEWVENLDVASDGNQALEFIKQKRYDIIFMDIQLPGMSGIDVMLAAKKIYRENEIYTPIIAVTANALKGDRELFLGEGFDYYVSKPYDKNSLNHSMNRVYCDEFLEFRKSFPETKINNLVKMITDLDRKTLVAYEQKKYVACVNYLGELRIIAKGFGFNTYAQKILKLQMRLRNEDYDAFIPLYQELSEMKQSLNIVGW